MIKNIFSIFALDTPQKRVIIFLIIIFIFSIIPTKYVESGESICIFKNFIIPLFFDDCPKEGIFRNCECPACGITRAFSSFLHFDFKSAWNHNKGIFLFMPILLIILIKDLITSIFEYKKHKKINTRKTYRKYD